MSSIAAANTLRSEFESLIAIPQGLKTLYDNQPNDKPTTGSYWIRWSVLFGDTVQQEFGDIGNPRTRTPGIAVAQVFGPKDAGDRKHLEIAQSIVDAFKLRTSGCVTLMVPSIRRIGVVGGEYQINVHCPFRYEE